MIKALVGVLLAVVAPLALDKDPASKQLLLVGALAFLALIIAITIPVIFYVQHSRKKEVKSRYENERSQR